MILVTGANGFLGSYLARMLVKKGMQVRAIKRPGSRLELLAEAVDKIEWIEADIIDLPAIEDAMKGCDQVYHCAAKLAYSPRHLDQLIKVNAEGTANLVNTAMAVGVKKFLHVSSIAALPGLDDRLINESTPWQLGPYPGSYGLSKYQADREVLRAQAEGLKTITIFPSNILGAGHWEEGSGQFFGTVRRGLPFYPTGSGGFVDVRDVARVAIRLMESDIENERFLVSAENYTYREIFNMIAKTMNKKEPFLPMGSLINMLGVSGDFLRTLLFGGERIITGETIKITELNARYDNSKLLKKIDFQYNPIEKCIAESVAVYQKNIADKKDWGYFSEL